MKHYEPQTDLDYCQAFNHYCTVYLSLCSFAAQPFKVIILCLDIAIPVYKIPHIPDAISINRCLKDHLFPKLYVRMTNFSSESAVDVTAV